VSAADVLAGRAQWAIDKGDVLDRLAALPDESVNCVITSPPYFGLRDYGTGEWVGGRPDCDHLPNNTRQRQGQTGGRATRAFTGFDPFKGVCGKCGAERVDRQIGLEATPADYVECIVAVFREVRRVLRSDGVAWVNLGDAYANDGKWGGSSGGKHVTALHGPTGVGRGKRDTGLKPKDLMGMPWRVAFALQADGWWLRSDVIWAKPNPMPESVTDRPTRSHEYLFLLTKAARYWYDADAIRESYADVSAGRYDYFEQATSPGARQPGGSMDRRLSEGGIQEMNPLGRNRRSVWTIATAPFPEAHFATFPPALVEPCILAGCPAGGVVLDPFVGSGTVVLEALRHGRRGIGIDLNPAYVAMARRRVEQDCPMFNTEAAG
jgi:DNA modification methylase